MNLNVSYRTGCLQHSGAFCCNRKRELMENDSFKNTIDIHPRIIIIKKTRACKVFCQTITIWNMGALSRKLSFFTEASQNISFKINGNTNLQPGANVSIDVLVELSKKQLDTKNLCVLILAEHPDIIWELPIIVLNKEQEIHVPEIICLPKVPATTASYYEFLVYNPKNNDIIFSVCSNYEGVTIKPLFGVISGKNFVKILVVGIVPPQPITTSIILTLRNGISFKIFVQMELTNQLIYLSTSNLMLEDTYVGLESQANLTICNRSQECVCFEWSTKKFVECTETGNEMEEDLIVSEFVTIRNKRGCIPAKSSILAIFTFTPPNNFEYNEEQSQFLINEVVYLYSPLFDPQPYKVNITGRIIGPNIQINPSELEVENLYMGQIHSVALEVLNKGPIPGEMYFKDHTDQNDVNCSVTPSSVSIEPDEKKLIHLSFYRRDVRKYLTKLNFKIKLGDFLSVLLRGTTLPPQVNIFPEIFEFGNIPICIPQKAAVNIYNPLPVSVVVEPKIIDDGAEYPLILCVDEKNLPLTTRAPTYYNLNYNRGKFAEVDRKHSLSDLCSNRGNSSRTNISSEISSIFQSKVLDDVPAMATELLQNLKAIHSKEQLEAGIRIIDASLDCIIDRCNYFEDLRSNRNYLCLNWKTLPCDAKEIAIQDERFYLEPQQWRYFPVILVPNNSGPGTKTIQFKVYPMGVDDCDIKDTIDASIPMVNSLRIEYNCRIPSLEYNNNITFEQSLYVDMENSFCLNFKNIDIVPGFVYFKVLPTSNNGLIKVEKNQQKFCIAPGENIEVACSVIFRKVGHIALHGIFKLVGKLLEYSFKVKAQVIPPEIQISTDKIFAKQEVLEMTRTKIIITNTSPTVAQLIFSLKNEQHQSIEPQGCSLAPNQKILISIFSKFLDPGLYKNSLYIFQKHSENLIVTLTFSAEGAPIEFEPNIKLGLMDFGTLFKSKKFQEHILKITNLGEKLYKINFQKIDPKKLTIVPVSVFTIEPKILTVAPHAQEIVKIQVDTSKEVKSDEEFCVDGIIEGRHRFKLFSFVAKCNVIESRVSWSKNEVRFETKNFQMTDAKVIEVVSLINTTPFDANANLNVEGCFVLGEDCASLKEKSLEFTMNGKTSKEIYVGLNENEIENPNLMCQCFKGAIKCRVNNKTQKSLPLHLKIVSPSLRICTPKVTLFPPYSDSFTHINIHNCSLLNAKFTWKEVESTIIDTPILDLDESKPYAKTISELILSMPKETIPKFPTLIKPEPPDLFQSDPESSEEDIPKSKIESIHSLVRKSSMRSYRSEDFIKSSSSLASLSYNRTSLRQPITCKPLPLATVETKKKDIGLKEIFEFLGLSEEMSNFEPSKTTCRDHNLFVDSTNYVNPKEMFDEPTKIVFQQMSGQIPPKSMFKAYIFLPTLPLDKTLVAKFNLEVVGGQTEVLELTVTSQKGRIHVSKTDINLGKNLWYKTIEDKITITSISQYALKITIIEANKFEPETNFSADGHIEITSPKQFILMPKTSVDIQYKVSLGFRQNFCQSIGLEVNNNTTAIPIRFRGSGVFPIIIPTKLKKISCHKNSSDVIASYFHLRDLFNDTQRQYMVLDENRTQCDKRDDLSIEKSSGQKSSKRNILRDYVLLIYSDERYPRAEEIERVVETEKFLFNLFKSNELMATFEKFHRKCTQLRAMEFESVESLKNIICRPIPWECSAFCVDMNEIVIDETKTMQIEMVFTGPGRLFLSLRSQIGIPGLMASFEVLNTKEPYNSFASFRQSSNNKIFKKYKNIHERFSDNDHIRDTEFKNLHSHSFDIDESGVHQRRKLRNDNSSIRQIKERYTKLSQPMKKEKNSLILTEIFQTTNNENLNEVRLQLNLELKATNEFFEVNQIIEDYLFIDVHLGPTIPLLLRGKIIPA